MKINNFELPEKIILNNKELFLNGAAVRTKFFINTYIVALYTEKPITHADDAIYSNIARSLRMLIITPLATPTTVSQSLDGGLKDSLGRKYSEFKYVADEIKTIIERANVGYKDYIDIFYDNNKTLSYLKNDKLLGEQSQDGQILAEALFNMYFGKKPKDEKIKRAMLRGF
jgi:hypothetical protein